MRVKDIFSFENIARMHREIEQLKDVIRELRDFQMPQLLAEISELKKNRWDKEYLERD
jgi:hypothetical protein